ncbi:unnamed protein product [Amoebophrya sp. A120]|nr:unnamed protein product [Amoebophrya sp. A120]|eukprot:GSA120T00005912001.1
MSSSSTSPSSGVFVPASAEALALAQNRIRFHLLMPSHAGVADLSFSLREEEPPGTQQNNATDWTNARVACVVVRGKFVLENKNENNISSSTSTAGADVKTTSFRLKQYLANDYCPAPYPHAALCPGWGEVKETFLCHSSSEVGPSTIAAPEVGAFAGVDYGGQTCACVALFGTLVEMRLLSKGRGAAGTCKQLVDEVFEPVLSSLRVAVASSSLLPTRTMREEEKLCTDAAKNTGQSGSTSSSASAATGCRIAMIIPYAKACYWSRHPGATHGYRGPSSLFDIPWNYGRKGVVPVWKVAGEAGDDVAAAARTLVVVGEGRTQTTQYHLDSVGVLYREEDNVVPKGAHSPASGRAPGREKRKIVETLLLYRCGPHHFVWLRRTSSCAHWPPKKGPFPLANGEYPKEMTVGEEDGGAASKTQTDGAAKNSIYVACCDERIGAWDAVWRSKPTHEGDNEGTDLDADYVVLLQASPSAQMDKDGFFRMLDAAMKLAASLWSSTS